MGLDLFSFLKNKVPKRQKIAFIGTFLISLLIHLYKFTNTLPNHDSLYNYYSDQNMLASGRWALSFACGISSYFDLPWVIGIFSCLFMIINLCYTALFNTVLDRFSSQVVILYSLWGNLFIVTLFSIFFYFLLFFKKKFFKIFCIGIYLIYSVVLASGIQQSDSVIHIHISILKKWCLSLKLISI